MVDDCYETETLHFDNPAFEKICLTVLITMKDSNRRVQYMRQLSENKPTATVVILHNKGFKKCRKENVRNTLQDLWHANQKAISLSSLLQKNKPLLILEDDVEFLPNFQTNARLIEKFFIRQKGACSYNLGSHVVLSVPSFASHIRVLLGGTNQAVLYNAKALKKMSSVQIGMVPHDLVLTLKIKTYIYKKPLTFQKLTQTANSKAWNICGIPLLISKMLGLGSSQKSFETSHFLASFGGILPCLVGIVISILILYNNKNTSAVTFRELAPIVVTDASASSSVTFTDKYNPIV